MRHPLLQSHSEVRKRVIALLQRGLAVRRSGNLIFVCGGNNPDHLRTKFRSYAENNLGEFQVFQPEFAMTDYFSDTEGQQLDLGNFETLIGELSHAIVIFPEAAGSFAETGYFSNVEKLSEKSILVLDMNHQKNDSFIMMGPARKYDINSKFSPNIQFDYQNPDFEIIRNRINRISFPKNLKFLDVSDLDSSYDLFCLIYKIYDILSLATIDDVIYIMNSLTSGHAPIKRIKDISSILSGASFIKSVGQYGHYFAKPSKNSFVNIRSGYAKEESDLKLQILEILNTSDDEFSEIMLEKSRAD